jgi:hypothetical protein
VQIIIIIIILTIIMTDTEPEANWQSLTHVH